MARPQAHTRIHLLTHANPVRADVARFGFLSTDAYLEFIREHLPPPLRLTCSRRLMEVVEQPERGGRRDDALRVRDLQDALDDPATLAIVGSSGGGYVSRILPHVRFDALARRAAPLSVLGFSELTGLVNLAASYASGRGVYWLCPNYLAWKVRPARAAREAFAAFWRTLPAVLSSDAEAAAAQLGFVAAIAGRLVAGNVREGPVRFIGGCLSVIVGFLAGPLGRRLRPDGRWLAIEDVNEAPYRIDRYLAALKIAGWFDRLAGVLIGDFHTREAEDQREAVVEILRFHLPPSRRVPVVTTLDVGHRWPMTPLVLNRPMHLRVRGRHLQFVP